MQINPKYRNNPTFNKALSTYSEATSSKKSGGLGTSTISCSNLDFKKEKNSKKIIYTLILPKNLNRIKAISELTKFSNISEIQNF